jgi:ParB family chromosome partitioning protein
VDAEALELAIIENVQRADLNVLEEAAAYQELMERFGRTQEQVAQEVGKSRSHIANSVRLLRLPDSVQAWLREGKLTAGHARTLLSAADPEAAAREILAGGMNVRQAEQRSVTKKKPTVPLPQDANIKQLESSISNKLGLTVQVMHKVDKQGREQGGEVRVSYKTLEQLDEIARRLSKA